MDKINMPITGICSFAKYPVCTDLDELDADIAVLGVPYDLGVGFLSGARLGPRRIREVSHIMPEAMRVFTTRRHRNNF